MVGLWISRTQHLGPVALPSCVSTRAPWRQRPGRYPPFHAPNLPRRRSTAQQHLTRGGGNDSPAHCPGADRPLCFPGCALSILSHGRFAMFRVRHRLLCLSIILRQRWGPGIGRERRPGPAGRQSPLPLRAPASDPTLIKQVKGTYSGEIKS